MPAKTNFITKITETIFFGKTTKKKHVSMKIPDTKKIGDKSSGSDSNDLSIASSQGLYIHSSFDID